MTSTVWYETRMQLNSAQSRRSHETRSYMSGVSLPFEKATDACAALVPFQTHIRGDFAPVETSYRRAAMSRNPLICKSSRRSAGSGGGTRTLNLRINSPTLCRLSYPGMVWHPAGDVAATE